LTEFGVKVVHTSVDAYLHWRVDGTST